MTALESTPEMNDIKLRYGTNTNSIDANTLINSILHFTSLVQEINKQLQNNRKVNVKVVAIEPGSFIVNIIVESGLIDTVTNLFTKENIAIAGGVVTTLKGVFEVAKLLKGDKPKSIETLENSYKIDSMNGESKIIDNRVFNVYNAPVIKQILSKEFETLENDTEVQSFEVTDKNGSNIAEFERNEFSDLANIEHIPDAATRINPKVVVLNIITLSFDPKKKWEFMLDGHKILATIKDEIFFEHIDKGEAFAKGDTLKVEIEITQYFNELAQAYGNHSYKVVKIIEHIRRSEQGKIF